MARRSRPRDPLARGRGSFPSSPHRAAPRDFLPHDLLEDAASVARVWSDLSPRDTLRTVYPWAGAHDVDPLYPPAKPRVARLSVFGGRAPSLFAGLRAPKRVLFCVRRKIRRESMFALRKIGFRGSSPGRRSKFNKKYYQRNYSSQYSCR